jgi:hypothetical protein
MGGLSRKLGNRERGKRKEYIVEEIPRAQERKGKERKEGNWKR